MLKGNGAVDDKVKDDVVENEVMLAEEVVALPVSPSVAKHTAGASCNNVMISQFAGPLPLKIALTLPDVVS